MQRETFPPGTLQNVPLLDTGARGSTTTFVQRKIGDVLVTWENEAYLSLRELGSDNIQIITPSLSILTEPPVALVIKNVGKKGSLEPAGEYLKYLYSEEAQDLVGKYYYCPTSEKALAKYAGQFGKTDLVTIADFGGWRRARKDQFEDGGTFDSIYEK